MLKTTELKKQLKAGVIPANYLVIPSQLFRYPLKFQVELIEQCLAKLDLEFRPHLREHVAQFMELFRNEHTIFAPVLKTICLLYFVANEISPGQFSFEEISNAFYTPPYYKCLNLMTDAFHSVFFSNLGSYHLSVDCNNSLEFSVFYDFEHHKVRQALKVPSSWIMKVHRLSDGKRVERPIAGERYSFNVYDPTAVSKAKLARNEANGNVELKNMASSDRPMIRVA